MGILPTEHSDRYAVTGVKAVNVVNIVSHKGIPGYAHNYVTVVKAVTKKSRRTGP